MLTKITTQSHKQEDGLQGDHYHTPMQWTHQLEEPGEDLQDQKKSTSMHPQIHQEEDSYHTGGEEDTLNKTSGK